MLVVEIPAEILKVGHPAPVSVRDVNGNLLIRKGTLVASKEQHSRLVSRVLYVDEAEGDLLKRALSEQLDDMLRQNTPLGKMAQAQPGLADLVSTAVVKKPLLPVQAWSELQMRAGVLLRDPPPDDFLLKLELLQNDLLLLIDQNADTALLILVHLISSECHQRHAIQTLLVTVLCELAARAVPQLNAEHRRSLRCAALSCHIAMAMVRDQLALQESPPSAQQLEKMGHHTERAVECLRHEGVTDPIWLEAIDLHHRAPPPSAFAELPPAWQMARLIERADRLASQLSTSKNKPAPTASEAAKSALHNAQCSVDAAGSLIIKATGIYPPGSYVRLSSGELGVVLQRGPNPTWPKVAALISRSGTPLGEPVIRNTQKAPHDVVSSVAPHEVKLRLNLERLIK